MHQNFSLNNQSNPASKCFDSQDNEGWQCLYPDSSTAMTSPDGTVLRFDPQGRIAAILSPDGREQKTFSYSAKGALLSFTTQGYLLSKVGNEWTDGYQLFDLEVSIDNLGVVTIIERNCGAVTSLHSNGTFSITAVAEPSSQYAVHHSAVHHNPVCQIDYPDRSKRCFQYNNFAELTIVDEPNGYWIKTPSAWVHYNSIGGRDGVEADEIKVDFNGTVALNYTNGTTLTVTANGARAYSALIALAA